MTPWRKAGIAVAGTCVALGTAGALTTAFLGELHGFGGTRLALLCWLGAGVVAMLTGLLGVLLSRPNRRAVGGPAPARRTADPRYTTTDRPRVS
ncbi:MAG: hypothetical protein WBA97_01315 [Actinophytocola sp.]|uniref:hypothetical protein n=1 Tax=Actinophytocola sp. TaxID=1872138 RepID=UPI003C7621A0